MQKAVTIKVRIEKGIANGEIQVPPSKSMSHRMLICAALAKGKSVLKEISDCEDVKATIECLSGLGVKFEKQDGAIHVEGSYIYEWSSRAPLFCRESGSTLRFLVPLALLLENEIIFEGGGSLMQRPMDVYEKLGKEHGFKFVQMGNAIAVKGPLIPGTYEFPGNISSQFVSGLLFALPLLKGDSEIRLTTDVQSLPYIGMTLAVLETFGVQASWKDKQSIKVSGGQNYRAQKLCVEGDASGAAFIDALNLFGGNVMLKGIAPSGLQADAVYPLLYDLLNKNSEEVSLSACPDLGPILFAIAAAKNGATFYNTERLKIKESNRVQCMAAELKKFGVNVQISEDFVHIDSAHFHLSREILHGYNDHRIVMALSVLLTLTGGEIDDAQAVSKSYPKFFYDLKELGIEVKEI
ncbi:MAG: 3-phosphoshikimate 1-carboxyvinyltransferase [Eggerthellaceae bacterium]|nr:3-phosphoshikimate 1-carboxyvinyltransferase [Eggerthellaceae bacterium]